jgi:hypothetical protein
MAQKAKFKKDWTFRATNQAHIAYKKDGGPKNDGEYRIPEAHYEAAKAAGVIEDVAETPAKAETKPKA